MNNFNNVAIKSINSLKETSSFSGVYLIADASIKTAKSGKSYLHCNVKDATGSITANDWNWGERDNQNLDSVNGKIMKIFGLLDEYKGNIQLNIQTIEDVPEAEKGEISKIIPSAPIEVQSTMDRISKRLQAIQNDDWRNICLYLFQQFKDDLAVIPAAKSMHHAFTGGLLMHTEMVMQMGISICRTRNIRYGNSRPTLDEDLVVAGSFCHDLAKNREYVFTEYGLVKDVTPEYILLGHLAMGSDYISSAATACGINPLSRNVTLLKHIVLSHHGEREKGACVPPAFAEAMIVSAMDDLDAKLEMMYNCSNSAASDNEMVYVPGLGRNIMLLK